MLQFDAMHTIDLGVSLYCLASVLFTIIWKDMLLDDKEACFAHVWSRLQEISKDLGMSVPLSRFTLKQIADPRDAHSSYPVLKSVKALNTLVSAGY